jgi:hypothetical protein
MNVNVFGTGCGAVMFAVATGTTIPCSQTRRTRPVLSLSTFDSFALNSLKFTLFKQIPWDYLSHFPLQFEDEVKFLNCYFYLFRRQHFSTELHLLGRNTFVVSTMEQRIFLFKNMALEGSYEKVRRTQSFEQNNVF